MESKMQRMEELMERSLDAVTSRPLFLTAVSTILNMNSYRKIWFRKTMEAVWKDLELPIRRDQDKLIHHIEELTLRIKKLELDLARSQDSGDPHTGTEEDTPKRSGVVKPVHKISAVAGMELR